MSESAQQLLVQGREAYTAGDYAKAESCLTQVLRQNRGFADVHNMLGVIYFHQGQLPKAREAFEEAIRINPRYVDAAINLAVCYNELGEYEKSEQVYRQAAHTSQPPTGEVDPFVKGKIANMYAAVGDVWLTQGRHEEARAEYQQALDLCPTFQDIRLKLAASFRETGELERAEALLRNVVQERPGYLKARIELGMICYGLGKKEEAKVQWEEVLRRDFGNKSARMYMRLILEGEKK